MKPYGALPRPRSRFKRPGLSWMRRLARASGLRLVFFVVYAGIILLPLTYLGRLARNRGWFYSTQERYALWQQLPDMESEYMIKAIYYADPQSPYMVMLNYVYTPTDKGPLENLLRQPEYHDCAEKARLAAMEYQLRHLENGWDYKSFECLLELSDQSRELDTRQLSRFRQVRAQAAQAILSMEPGDGAQTQLLADQLAKIWQAPPALDESQRQQLTQIALQNSNRILVGGEGQHFAQGALTGISSSPDLLKQLRCLHLNVCLHLNAELEPLLNTTGQKLFGRQLPLAQEHLRDQQQAALLDDLAIMGHCQRLFAPGTAQQDSAWRQLVSQASQSLHKPADELLHGL